MKISLDFTDLREVIKADVDAAVRQHMDRQPRDDAGQVLVDKRTAARLMATSESTIDRWRNNHGLPFLKLTDGKVLFRASALEEWAAEQEEGAKR